MYFKNLPESNGPKQLKSSYKVRRPFKALWRFFFVYFFKQGIYWTFSQTWLRWPIWVGFPRTGILPVLCHFLKNFDAPLLWPNLYKYLCTLQVQCSTLQSSELMGGWCCESVILKACSSQKIWKKLSTELDLATGVHQFTTKKWQKTGEIPVLGKPSHMDSLTVDSLAMNSYGHKWTFVDWGRLIWTH